MCPPPLGCFVASHCVFLACPPPPRGKNHDRFAKKYSKWDLPWVEDLKAGRLSVCNMWVSWQTFSMGFAIRARFRPVSDSFVSRFDGILISLRE